MASGREKAQEMFDSSDDESEYKPQPKRSKISTPTAGTSASAVRDVENSPSSPQIIRLENKLKVFLKDITKAFPRSRYGSDRDAFCFRRVKGHLGVFKRECIDECKSFVDSKQWKNAINYVIIAWPYVDQLPRWNDPKHNKVNEQCYKKLSSYLANSLKKGKFQKQELQNFISRLENLIEANESNDAKDNGMQSSIQLAKTILKKIK